jgi:cyanophycin synthetase
MRILKTQTLRGPNYWSIRHPNLILMRLDLEDVAELSSDQIPGFYEALADTLPSLIEHFCSPGHRGGFLSRVRQGTYMGHIVEHVALELQTLAGMAVGFGRTRQTVEPGVYQVVFEYQNEEAGRYAARAAVRLCNSLITTGHYPSLELEKDLRDLEEFRLDGALGPSTEAIVRAAETRDVPWTQLSTRSMIQLGYGRYQQRVQATLSSKTSILAVELASDKEGTKQILRNAGVPVPRGTVINYLDELEEAINEVGGYPIVVKPLDGNHGRGITIDISTYQAAQEAYEAARNVSKGVIIERFYRGQDHRVLVVNGQVIAVAERVPAHVVGDGRSTIEQLIDLTNQDPRRGEGHDNLLTRIEVDRTTWQLLDRKGYSLDTVLPRGRCVIYGLRRTSAPEALPLTAPILFIPIISG